MKKVICNPMNLSYKYQFLELRAPAQNPDGSVNFVTMKKSLVREAADPSIVLFKGRYYLFPSMSKGFWVTDSLTQDWQFVKLQNTPSYDYAPDVSVVGDYLYFSASRKGEPCKFYRTKDPMSGIFEEYATAFEFWDPALFCDEDGRMYFFWGCTNTEPLYGVELNPEDMSKKGEVFSLIAGNNEAHGFERIGDDHVLEDLPPDASDYEKYMRMYIGTAPFIEGAWMTKKSGKYYLQYAAPGTEYNVYADGVYESDHPLKGYKYAANNPYSYKPGGFINAAGHGSTFEDKHGNLWHTSSMRISVGHQFERRLGLFPAGIDEDGVLFCNQRYGDWPLVVPDGKMDPWAEPEMFLLSFKKDVTASSHADGHQPNLATDENIRTWWSADKTDKTPWIQVDLGDVFDVKAIQINFADNNLQFDSIPQDVDATGDQYQIRYIEDKEHKTRWLLEGSVDGKTYFTLCDKRNVSTDLPHDLVLTDSKLRYVKLTVNELPYNQQASVSGLRVFGKGTGHRPGHAICLSAKRMGDLDAEVSWKGDAVGYNVLWGFAPDKLYHSYMVFDKSSLNIRALNKGQRTWVRIDSFNENGIKHGRVIEIK